MAAAALLCTAPVIAQAPANDDCVGAITATLGLTSFDSTLATDGAGLELDPVVCDPGDFGDDQIYQDLWYAFTPATTDSYEIAAVNNGNTPFDSRLAIYDQVGCPDDPVNVIDCDDDEGPGAEALMSGVNLTGGTSYLIRVGSFSATTTEQPAALSISVTPPPPAHDACGMAIAATVGMISIDNTLATLDGTALDPLVCDLDASADDRIYNDLWFLFTAPVDGQF